MRRNPHGPAKAKSRPQAIEDEKRGTALHSDRRFVLLVAAGKTFRSFHVDVGRLWLSSTVTMEVFASLTALSARCSIPPDEQREEGLLFMRALEGTAPGRKQLNVREECLSVELGGARVIGQGASGEYRGRIAELRELIQFLRNGRLRTPLVGIGLCDVNDL